MLFRLAIAWEAFIVDVIVMDGLPESIVVEVELVLKIMVVAWVLALAT